MWREDEAMSPFDPLQTWVIARLQENAAFLPHQELQLMQIKADSFAEGHSSY
jgi:hypothetical protein